MSEQEHGMTPWAKARNDVTTALVQNSLFRPLRQESADQEGLDDLRRRIEDIFRKLETNAYDSPTAAK